MRTVIGWVAALLASALLGATVYQVALSTPLPDTATGASQAWPTQVPVDPPTVYQTLHRTVVDPTPTVTVDVPVVVTRTAAPVVRVTQQAGRRASTTRPRSSSARPATTRTRSSKAEHEDEDEHEHEDEHEDDD